MTSSDVASRWKSGIEPVLLISCKSGPGNKVGHHTVLKFSEDILFFSLFSAIL